MSISKSMGGLSYLRIHWGPPPPSKLCTMSVKVCMHFCVRACVQGVFACVCVCVCLYMCVYDCVRVCGKNIKNLAE